MKLDQFKLCECLRIYSMLLPKCVKENLSLYDGYIDVISKNVTSLTTDDYETMLLVKNFYSACNILYHAKDTFIKGLSNIDPEVLFLDNNLPVNKTCIDNYTFKDIILYIRNALAHSKQGLFEIIKDNNDIRIHVKLNNTIATKGPNIGKNVPFEVEFNQKKLLSMSFFCAVTSQTPAISGVDFDDDIVVNYNGSNMMDLLRKTVDGTYYSYTLFNQINDRDRLMLMKTHQKANKTSDFTEYDRVKSPFVRKEEIVEFSPIQRDCLYYALSRRLSFQLSFNDMNNKTVLKKLSTSEMKNILGVIMDSFYEYEALKVIPMGKEKYNISLVSFLLNISNRPDETLKKTLLNLIIDLSQKRGVYGLFSSFNIPDKQETKMFGLFLGDYNYIIHEAEANYYNSVFENYVHDGEIVVIGGINYPGDRIRNSFTHGRWFYDEKNECWELFDNKDSLRKPDQYKFDWSARISNKSLRRFVNQRFLEEKKKSESPADLISLN